MRVLLDTHTLLWFFDGNPRINATVRSLIEDLRNEIFVSIASIWEISIKVSLGKMDVGEPFEAYFTQQIAINKMAVLNISLRHAAVVRTLPFHHRDPFDRMLIAQALSENLTLVNNETLFDAYGVARMW